MSQLLKSADQSSKPHSTLDIEQEVADETTTATLSKTRAIAVVSSPVDPLHQDEILESRSRLLESPSVSTISQESAYYDSASMTARPSIDVTSG